MKNRHFLIRGSIFIFLNCLILFALGCESSTKPEEEDNFISKLSAIQPKPLLLENSIRLSLSSPIDGSEVTSTGTDSSQILFQFIERPSKYQMVLILDSMPKGNLTLDNALPFLKKHCIAGATNLTKSGLTKWNVNSALLSNNVDNQFFKCDTTSLNGMIHTSEENKFTPENFPADSYYFWVILGYDQSYYLNYSSQVDRFYIP